MKLRRFYYSVACSGFLALLLVVGTAGKPTASDLLQPDNTLVFGPIIDPGATPEPLHTPFPAELHTRPCETLVTAPMVSLHAAPDPQSNIVDAAGARQRFVVTNVVSHAEGWSWADTPDGWLPLTMDGLPMAELLPLRGCDVLTGAAPNTTLLGLHMVNGMSSAEVLQFVQQMRAAGHPLGTLKGLNGAEATLNQVEIISPETVTVYRSVHLFDCPEGNLVDLDPAETAQQWMADMLPYWRQVNADYYELWHECGATLNWIADFSIEAMRYANDEGVCLLLFSFPGGNPEMDTFDDLVPVYQYALEHPCAPGRTHGIAMHAFSLDDNTLVSQEDVWVALRHRIFYARLQDVFPAGGDVPVYITEVGIGGRTIRPPCDIVVRDALQYTFLLEHDPYVKGFHLWNVGTGEQWYDITACLPALSNALIEYYAGGQ